MPISPGTCRASRALFGWSMRDLADRAGVSLGAVNRLEGGRTVPRDATAAKIVAAFAAHAVELTPPDGRAVAALFPLQPGGDWRLRAADTAQQKWPKKLGKTAPSPLRGRRLARLNQHDVIPARVDVEIWDGEFGRGLRRRRAVLFLERFAGKRGAEYIQCNLDYGLDSVQATHPAFGNDDDALSAHAIKILADLRLPRPGAPGYFWDDDRGRLRWSTEADAPPDHVSRSDQFTGFFGDSAGEEIAAKFIEDWDEEPLRFEAVYASEWLDTVASRERVVSDMIAEWVQEFAPAPKGDDLKATFWARRDDFTDTAIDAGIALGQRLGALKAEWRLYLTHGSLVLNEQSRRSNVTIKGLQARNAQKQKLAERWKRRARELAAERKGSATTHAKSILIALRKEFPALNLEVETVAREIRAARRELRNHRSS